MNKNKKWKQKKSIRYKKSLKVQKIKNKKRIQVCFKQKELE